MQPLKYSSCHKSVVVNTFYYINKYYVTSQKKKNSFWEGKEHPKSKNSMIEKKKLHT